MQKTLSIGILLAFLANSFGSLPSAQAQEFRLPTPGVMVHLSPPLDPPILKGIKVDPDNPFRFDFILDKGGSYNGHSDAALRSRQDDRVLKQEATKLIKYFLASLTIPENDLWVNLSPYEKDRIIPNSFGLTEMGRDLLAEDYMLKQVTASLIYPEDAIGKKFWKRIYEEAYKKFGTTNIPVNTFNKVWIVPEKAVVYENVTAGTAYVVESKLKVMLEQDYLALTHNVIPAKAGIQNKNDINALHASPLAIRNETASIGSNIVREVVIPELTKEVNEGKNFVQLRQVYNSLILAYWYKKKIKESILEQVYASKNKVAGINIDNPREKEKIYQRYLQAFKKGVYNYIKEDQDPMSKEAVPRKYFSGGTSLNDAAMAVETFTSQALQVPDIGSGNFEEIGVNLVTERGSGTKPIMFQKSLAMLTTEKMNQNADRAMGAYTRIDVSEMKFNPDRKELKIGDEILKLLSNSGENNFIFLYQDKYVIRVSRKPRSDLRPSWEKRVNKFKDLSSPSVAISPVVYQHGYVEYNQKEYGFMIVDWIVGQTLNATEDSLKDNIRAIPLEDRTGMMIHVFDIMIRKGIYIPDSNTEQYMIGYSANDPNETVKIWLVDAELATINEENPKYLPGICYQTFFRKGWLMPNLAVNVDVILDYLKPKISEWQTEELVKMREDDNERYLKSKKALGIDNAMLGKGGIDLTPTNMHLQTKAEDSGFRGNGSKGIIFRNDPAMLQELRNAMGFMPVITSMQPMADVKEFLGIAS